MFFSFITNKKKGPHGYPYGKVVNYFYRHEFQNRNSIHTHMALWVDPSSKPSSPVFGEIPRYLSKNVATLRN